MTLHMFRQMALPLYRSTTRVLSPQVVTGDRTLNGPTHLRRAQLTSLTPDSVRITSQDTYNGGLFIADFSKFAYGPTIWPAFWSESLPAP